MAKQIPLPKKYSIPKSWKWIEIGSLAMMRSGYPFDSKKFSNDHEGRKPLIRIRDVVRGETSTFTNEHCPDEYTIHYGDVLIGMDGDFNVAKWKSEDALLNQRVCYICSTSKLLLNDYLFYYLPDPLKKINDATPSVTVKHLSTKTLAKTLIPLPPLPEQQRIVDRIESLFAKLDEAKEKAQAVVDGFEDRKAAIVTLGINGALTIDWRNKHSVNKENWTTTRLSEIAMLQTGLMKGKRFKSKTVLMPYLRVANVQDGFLNLNEIKQIEVEENNIDRYLLREGDVLFTEGGDYDKLGRGTVWHNEIENCLHQNHIFVVRTDHKRILPEFLSLQAGSQYGKRYFLSCAKQTTNLASINSTQLKNFPIVLPSIEEQQEIVRIIDSVVSRESEAKSVAGQIIDQINTMKKSILARAFRGELGTNDPADESAEEILKKTLWIM